MALDFHHIFLLNNIRCIVDNSTRNLNGRGLFSRSEKMISVPGSFAFPLRSKVLGRLGKLSSQVKYQLTKQSNQETHFSCINGDLLMLDITMGCVRFLFCSETYRDHHLILKIIPYLLQLLTIAHSTHLYSKLIEAGINISV